METETTTHPRKKLRNTAMVTIAGTALAIGGVGAAWAQTSSSTPSTPTQSQAQPAMRAAGPMGRGLLHSEGVAQKSDGTFETIDTQEGQVTAVSSSSITVKSSDNFLKTYSVNDQTSVNAGRDGIASVKSGDTVHLAAVVSGGNDNAVDIADTTNLTANRQNWAPGGAKGGMGPDTAPPAA